MMATLAHLSAAAQENVFPSLPFPPKKKNTVRNLDAKHDKIGTSLNNQSSRRKEGNWLARINITGS